MALGRLFVDASGNVKIGSTDNSTVATTYVAIGNPGITPGGIQLWSTTAGNSYIQFGDGTSATDQYRGYLGYVHSSDSLVFGTSTAERLRITSAGLVGVGTSAPSKKFEVANGDVRLSDGYTISWGDDAWRIFRNGSQLRFDANGTQALTIDSSQRVGIGTSSPAALLHLSATAGNQELRFSDTTNSAMGRIYESNGLAIISETNHGISFQTNATGRGGFEAGGNFFIDTNTLYVDATNNRVGIGTTSPGNLLHVSGTGTVCQLASSNNNNLINLKGNGATNGVWLGTTSSDDFVISSGASVTERARIDSSGRLGIGTSGPSSQLDVRGSATDFDGLRVLNTNSGSGTQTSAAIRLGITNSFGAVNGIRNCRIQATENNTDSNDVHLDFYTNSAVGLDQETVKMRLTAGGALGIGTTSASTILHVASTAPYIRIQDTDSSTGVTAQGGFEMYDNDGDRLFYLANESSSSSDVSLFNIAGGALKFGTSGSERGQFDSSGRLLVGTSSALTGSNSQYSKVVALGNSANNAGGYFSIAAGSARGNDEDVANLWFTDNGAGEYASIRVFADGATGSGDYPGRLVFSTTADGASSPTERMRITNTGYTTNFATTDGFRVSSAAAAGTGTDLFIGAHSATVIDTGTISFRVTTNGNTTNTNNSYAGISDIKLKENIADANSQWNDLKALQVRKYNFKEETGQQTHTQIGLVAQEVELVSPGLS
jgi:hypothetical protein